jgi:hypothetical protein
MVICIYFGSNLLFFSVEKFISKYARGDKRDKKSTFVNWESYALVPYLCIL